MKIYSVTIGYFFASIKKCKFDNNCLFNYKVMKTSYKILVTAASFLLMATGLFAKSGIEGGYLNTMYTTKTDGVESVEKSDPLQGFYVGVNNDWKIVAGLSVQPGLYYSYGKYSDSEEEAGFRLTASQTEHNLNIPIDIKYTFGILPILKIHVFVGPTFSVGLASQTKVMMSGEVLGQQLEVNAKYDMYSGKIKTEGLPEGSEGSLSGQLPSSVMSRFDVMIGGGVGIDLFKFLTVKAGYDYGLLNRLKGDIAQTSSMNRSQFYVAVGINF